MHFSAPLVLSSLFSLSLALPQSKELKGPQQGRLMVSYNEPTYKTYGMKAGVTLNMPEDTRNFTISAYNSVYPEIHRRDIVASNGKFYIGNLTQTVCPTTVEDCPPGNMTVLRSTAEGNAYLDVVNQTQIIYVDAHSQLRFDPPGVKPGADAKNATFALTINPIPAPPGSSALTFSGVGRSTGYLGCPIPNTRPNVWQVFVSTPTLQGNTADPWVPTGDVSDCIGFDAFATDYTGDEPAAYQYD
ncbi:MAG: hypothetical protein Q9169_007283 [Polycauliona sp. 2 TL-2023]